MITSKEVEQFEKLVKQLCASSPGGEPEFLQLTLVMIEQYNDEPTYTNASVIQNVLREINATEQKLYSEPLGLVQGWVHREMEAATKEELEGRLRDNSFRTSSDLQEYRNAFGQLFIEYLSSLDAKSRWLDAGAGQALAMRKYLEGGGQAKCLACSFEIPANALKDVQSAEEKYGERFRYLSGKYFGEFSDKDFGLPNEGAFKLITDLNGVLYYTQTFLEDLKRYTEMLAVNGKLCCTYLPGLRLTLSGHQDLNYRAAARKWLAGITNMSLTVYETGVGDSYILTKTGEPNKVPETAMDRCYTVKDQNATQTELSCKMPIIGEPTVIKV